MKFYRIPYINVIIGFTVSRSTNVWRYALKRIQIMNDLMQHNQATIFSSKKPTVTKLVLSMSSGICGEIVVS